MANAPQSLVQGLQKILQSITEAMTAQDTDIQFLQELQQAVLGRIHMDASKAMGAQQQGMQGQAQQAMGGAQPQQGQPQGQPQGQDPSQGQGQPQGQQAMGAPQGPGMGGGMPMSPQMNPDELRRILSQGN